MNAYLRIVSACSQGPSSGEFPLPFIISLSLISIVGVVVQPHFIATGGGSAKTEKEARIGLVVGNFLKRLCTVGWALTALIALALVGGECGNRCRSGPGLGSCGTRDSRPNEPGIGGFDVGLFAGSHDELGGYLHDRDFCFGGSQRLCAIHQRKCRRKKICPSWQD